MGQIPNQSSVAREDECGSAVAEFVLVALPLFLPALLFFLAMNQVSRAEMEADFLAREAVQVFTSSSNDLLAHARVNKLLHEYSQLHDKRLDGAIVKYSVRCSNFPCITPGGAVELEVDLEFAIDRESQGIYGSGNHYLSERDSLGATQRTAIGSARGFVDKWG